MKIQLYPKYWEACSKVFLASELNFLSSTVCRAKLKQTKSRELAF